MKIIRFLSVGVLTLLMGAAMATPLTPDQITQVQQITRDYMLNNPQILIEMSKKLQAQEQQKAQVIANKLIRQNAKAIFNAPGDLTVGNAQGNITLVEFFDYQCPNCKIMSPVVDKAIQSDPQLRVVFKLLPILGSNSVYAAKAAYASEKQGKFFAFHKALLASDTLLTKDTVIKIAKSVGLDVTKLKSDMNDKAYDKKFKETFQLAMNILQPSMGVIATPAYVIGNREGTKFVFMPGQISEATLQKAIKDVQ